MCLMFERVWKFTTTPFPFDPLLPKTFLPQFPATFPMSSLGRFSQPSPVYDKYFEFPRTSNNSTVIAPEHEALLSPTISELSDESTFEEHFANDTVLSEAKEITVLAFPVSLSYILQMVFGLSSVYACGHIGPKELAAAALANMFGKFFRSQQPI